MTKAALSSEPARGGRIARRRIVKTLFPLGPQSVEVHNP